MEKLRDKCPQCGYKYSEETEQEETTMKDYLFPIIAGLVFITLIFLAVDNIALQSRYCNELFLKKDCSFVIPDGYEIVTDGKLFVVKVSTSYGDKYLCEGSYDITEYSLEISKPSLFFSECKAKSYIKKYMNQNGAKWKIIEENKK